jgi:predicted NUDIX family NTP pyrophosphohydrolase
MTKKSAGLLMYRFRRETVEVLLVHPGGPFWAKKDLGAWSIPKGEYTEDEDPLEAARREFQEETGFTAYGTFISLSPVRYKSGKRITAWAVEGDLDASLARSNTFKIEWPPRSGIQKEFPEVDRAQWFPIDIAKEKINKGQTDLLDQLPAIMGTRHQGR